MRKLTATLATDTPARDNTRIAIQSIHRAWRDSWSEGSPVLVAHDGCRPMGWAWPTCIYLEPGRGLLLGKILVPESQDERQNLLAHYNSHLNNRIKEKTQNSLPKLKSLLANNLDGFEYPLDVDATILVGAGLARRVAPSIFAHEDKDGLVPLNQLSPVRVLGDKTRDGSPYPAPDISTLSGVFKFGDLLLFAHPYFRRSLSRLNPLNFELLTELYKLSQINDSVKIKLDPDAVGLTQTVRIAVEYAYWYGPIFDDTLTSIPPGITVYAANDEQRFYGQVSRTEFWWKSHLNKETNVREHILEAEELRDQPTDGGLQDRYGCRYVHSIVRESDNVIEHLDGSIREYGLDEILVRLENNIASNGKKTCYTKLWRVDGDVPLNTWKTLIHHYFRENPLIYEYFTGQKDPIIEEIQQESQRTEQQSIVEKFVPHSINAGEGIRLSLFYRPNTSANDDAQRILIPNIQYFSEGQSTQIIDAEIIELRKVLQVAGQTLCIPPHVKLVSFCDRYIALPPILSTSREYLGETLRALGHVVAAWQKRHQDFVISLSLGVVDDNHQTWLSAFGHLSDIAVWLRRGSVFPPSRQDEIDAWLSLSVEHLHGYPQRSSGGNHDLLGDDQNFCIARHHVPHEYVKTRRADDELGGMLVELDIPPVEHELYEAVKSGSLSLCIASLVNSVDCPCCHRSYVDCPHSVCLEGVSDTPIFHVTPLGFFWTDRPA